MRLRSAVLASAVAVVPLAARAQISVPPFSRVLSTYAVAGCAPPTLQGPCTLGTAAFGQIDATSFGLRLDLAADFSTFQGPLPLIRARLATGTELRFATASASAPDCFLLAGQYVNGECIQTVGGLGPGYTGVDVLAGQTVAYFRPFSTVGGPPFALVAPTTFRLIDASLVYEFADAQGSTTRLVRAVATPTTPAVIPEPSTFALAAAGGLALAARAARRRRRIAE